MNETIHVRADNAYPCDYFDNNCILKGLVRSKLENEQMKAFNAGMPPRDTGVQRWTCSLLNPDEIERPPQ